MTPDERLRVEQILATIDEIESEESKSKNIGGDNQLIRMDPDAARLSRIDNLLEEKYSFSNKIEATNELRLEISVCTGAWRTLYRPDFRC